MSETYITEADSTVHQVDVREFKYELNQAFHVGERITIASKTVEDGYVSFYKIVSRSREYVLNEDEWYIHYEIMLFDSHNMSKGTHTLSESGIDNDGFTLKEDVPQQR